MKPIKLKKLKLQEILISPDHYCENDQRTTVGWLQEFFLFNSDDEYTHLTDQDWVHFNQAISEFKKLNNIGKQTILESWEDKTPKKQQLEFLNNFIEVFNASGKKSKKKTQEEGS